MTYLFNWIIIALTVTTGTERQFINSDMTKDPDNPAGKSSAQHVIKKTFVGPLFQSLWKWFCILLSLTHGVVHAGEKAEKRPNMLLIIADDLGYSHLGCYPD